MPSDYLGGVEEAEPEAEDGAEVVIFFRRFSSANDLKLRGTRLIPNSRKKTPMI